MAGTFFWGFLKVDGGNSQRLEQREVLHNVVHSACSSCEVKQVDLPAGLIGEIPQGILAIFPWGSYVCLLFLFLGRFFARFFFSTPKIQGFCWNMSFCDVFFQANFRTKFQRNF